MICSAPIYSNLLSLEYFHLQSTRDGIGSTGCNSTLHIQPAAYVERKI